MGGVLITLGGGMFSFILLDPVSGANPAVTTSVNGASNGCSVSLVFSPPSNPTQVTARILSGCTGGDYYLTSWQAQSDVFATSHPQTFYQTTNAPPWTVQLPVNIPPCYWQVDFSKLSSRPPAPSATRQFIAGRLGGSACPITTTTTSTTTTLPKPTTTTSSTLPKATTTTTSTTLPGGTTTSTSLPGGGTTTTVPPNHGGTTTTTLPGTAPGGSPGGGGPGAAPAGSAPSSGVASKLAFTGFLLVAFLFIAALCIGSGIALLRVSRRPAAYPVAEWPSRG